MSDPAFKKDDLVSPAYEFKAYEYYVTGDKGWVLKDASDNNVFEIHKDDVGIVVDSTRCGEMKQHYVLLIRLCKVFLFAEFNIKRVT